MRERRFARGAKARVRILESATRGASRICGVGASAAFSGTPVDAVLGELVVGALFDRPSAPRRRAWTAAVSALQQERALDLFERALQGFPSLRARRISDFARSSGERFGADHVAAGDHERSFDDVLSSRTFPGQ
jgi:hypothetical protein